MQTLKERKPLLIKIMAVILLVLLCCNLPSLLYSLLFWPLCLKQDRDIPPNTEILISACNKKRVNVTVTPDGKALFVTKSSPDSSYRLVDIYLLGLSTGEKRDVPFDDPFLMGQGELLSSELFWWWSDPDYIIDLNDGQRYELIDLGQMPRLEGFKFDPKYYAYFQSADQVFILQKENMVIALSPEFRQNPEGNVILSQYALGDDAEKGELLEKLMNDLGVEYKIVDFPYPYYYDTDIHSPAGKYVVHDDGIYLSEKNNVVVNRDMSDFQGWYYDESAVVLGSRGHYLIDLGSAFGGSYEYFFIPGPTLKLRLPVP